MRCFKRWIPLNIRWYILADGTSIWFECLNTLSDQLLEDINVRLEPPAGYRHLSNVPCSQLPYNVPGSIFYSFEFPANAIETLGSFSSTLEFTVRDCDPTTGLPDSYDGYPDSYRLEEFELGCADQLRTRAASSDWEATWAIGGAGTTEACDTFALSQTDVGEAAKAVCEHLGMPMESVSGDAVKEIRGGGLWRTGVPALLRARLVAAQGSVTMQLMVRSPNEELAVLLLAAVG